MTTTPDTTDATQNAATDDSEALGENGRKALDRERDARRKAEATVREVRKELERRESEHSHTLEEATATARSEAFTALGSRLARAEFDKRATKRNNSFDTDGIADYIPVTKFLTDDGDLVDAEIDKAVEALVPEAAAAPTGLDLDLGARSTGSVNGKRSNAQVFEDLVKDRLS